MKKFDIKRIIGAIVGVVLVVAVLAITDGKAEKELMGTWQINQGTFLFIEDGTSREYKTDYRIEDGNTLYLQTDGLILTKVK